MKYKSPINWFGGKYYMANKLNKIIPEHEIYVEVFGGAGHLLFKKDPSKVEVYNDIDSGLYSFFKVLRDEQKSNLLKNKLDLTPYSREEFYYCRDTWKSEQDEIEKVRKWYVTCMQSFSSNFNTWSYRTKSRRGMSMSVSMWLGNIEKNLPDAVNRLKLVQVENIDFRKIIKKYDKESTLFYLDPPYIHDTRKMTYTYACELQEKDHIELVDILLNINGKAILSGYDHSIYNKLIENGWQKILLGQFDKRSIKAIDESREKGEEILWVNFNIEEIKVS